MPIDHKPRGGIVWCDKMLLDDIKKGERGGSVVRFGLFAAHAWRGMPRGETLKTQSAVSVMDR